ncbi:MAG: glutaredoxin domain-containing protein [Patescibacteria group bacterium]|jgi:glutaredoxin-like YruB-family protein
MAKVKVFSTPTCPYCVQAKEYLKSKGVEYEEVDVAADEAGRNEMVEKTEQMGVPVILIGDEYIVGFDRAKIDELLAK